MKMNKQELVRNFVGRDKQLSKVLRYKIYKTMYYRTDLVIHSSRVAWIIEELNPYATMAFGKAYDPVKAVVMGLVHDDTEIVMGDVEAGIKNKMSPRQLAQVYQSESEAIEKVAQKFPREVGGYNYRQLLQESFDHSSLESQVMQYADKFDALGEALHEVYAGNRCFTTNVVNDYGVIDLPVSAYYKYFAKFRDKFPDMRKVLDTKAGWFQPLPQQDIETVVANGKPHTLESIARETGYWPYDLWIKANLKYSDNVERDRLIKQIEF